MYKYEIAVSKLLPERQFVIARVEKQFDTRDAPTRVPVMGFAVKNGKFKMHSR